MSQMNKAARALPPLSNALLRALLPLGLLAPACADAGSANSTSAGESPTYEALDSEFRHHPGGGGHQGQTTGGDDKGSESGGSESGGSEQTPLQTPETLPPATPIDRGRCGAPLEVQYGDDDEDGDGEPDAVRVVAVPPAEGCNPVRYCKLVVAADGSETYEEVESTPLYSDDFPVPAAAVTNSCADVPGTSTCPTLSNGQPADNCKGLAEDRDCLTVTFCPEPGAAEDPSDPDYTRTFTPRAIDKIADLLPDGVQELEPGEVARFDLDNSPLFIHPCEWEESVHSYDMGFDVTGNKGGEGAECNTDADCNSGVCGKGEADFFGSCTKAESKVRFDLDEGNGVIHVDSGAGIPEARSRVQRAAFFPSTSFDVKSTMLAYANAVILGSKLPILNATIDSEITECRHALRWSAEAFQLDSPIIAKLGGTLKKLGKEGSLDISVFSEGELDTGDDVTPEEEYQQCETAKQALWNQERLANEALHDALIATTFWNEAGASGAVINSREAAEERVQNYQYAVNGYLDALAEFKRQQDGAIIRERAVLVARHERGIEAGYALNTMIGPVPITVEVGATGSWGLNDMQVENGVRTQTVQDCEGVECMHVRTETSGTPWSDLSGYAFGGVGGSVGPLSVAVGITAELTLVRYETPLRSAFALERVTWGPEEAAQALSNGIPAPLQPVLGTDPAVLQDERFLIQPQIGQFQAPFSIGGGIDSPDEVLTHASFLDGRIKFTAKVKLWFAKVKFEYPFFTWKGIEKSWKVADGATGDALQGRIGLPVPNMVLLPRLQLNDAGGTASPSEANENIRLTFDIRKNRGSSSHAEAVVGTPWDDKRCRIQTIIR